MGGGAAGTVQLSAEVANAFEWLFWSSQHSNQILSTEGVDESADGAKYEWDTGYSMFNKGKDAVDNNPFTGESAYDPDSLLLGAGTEIQTKYDLAMAEIAKLIAKHAANDDWGVFLDEGRTHVDTYIINAITAALATINDAVVDAEVDEYESDVNEDFLRGLSRFTGGMAEINATSGSAFVMGMALMENSRAGAVRKYRATLRREIFQLGLQIHSKFTSQAVSEMLNLLGTRATLEIEGTKLLNELNKTKIIAKIDEKTEGFEIEGNEQLWPLDIHARMGNIVASAMGGTMIPGKPSAVSSTLSGAAAGALVGSTVPVIGTAIGAGVGALLGAAGAT